MGGVVSDVVSGVGDAVSGVGNAVSDILSSDVGKAAALGAGLYATGGLGGLGGLGGAGALDTMALGDMAATGAVS